MAKTCFIGIDQGSSSTKALVISTEGQVLRTTRKNLSLPVPDETRVEHDPHEILKSVKDVLDEFLRRRVTGSLGTADDADPERLAEFEDRARHSRR